MSPHSVQRISTTRPLAKRLHVCSVCGKPIAIGATYERTVWRDLTALDKKQGLRVMKWHLPRCEAVR